jgi:hypothetical protein
VDFKLGIEVLSLLVAIGAAVFAALKARAASRAARAAERSAEVAERNYLLSERKLGLDIADLKERWVEKLGAALRDHGRDGVSALLPMLPDELRPQWLEIMDLAAKAGKIVPQIWERKREKWVPEWERVFRGDK